MKTPEIPQYKGIVRIVAIVIAVVLMIDLAVNFIPLAWLIPILLLLMVVVMGYKLYYSVRQGCKSYAWLLIAEMIVMIAACIIIIYLSK